MQRKHSVFKKMGFTETNERKIGHFHSLFFVITAYEAFFDEFVSSTVIQGMQIPFLVHAKDE